jgi:hypothetical protein
MVKEHFMVKEQQTLLKLHPPHQRVADFMVKEDWARIKHHQHPPPHHSEPTWGSHVRLLFQAHQTP